MESENFNKVHWSHFIGIFSGIRNRTVYLSSKCYMMSIGCQLLPTLVEISCKIMTRIIQDSGMNLVRIMLESWRILLCFQTFLACSSQESCMISCMIFAWILHGLRKILAWSSQESCMIFTRILHDLCKNLAWSLQNSGMIFARILHDLHNDRIRFLLQTYKPNAAVSSLR